MIILIRLMILTYDQLEDRRIDDVTINSILLFYHVAVCPYGNRLQKTSKYAQNIIFSVLFSIHFLRC